MGDQFSDSDRGQCKDCYCRISLNWSDYGLCRSCLTKNHPDKKKALDDARAKRIKEIQDREAQCFERFIDKIPKSFRGYFKVDSLRYRLYLDKIYTPTLEDVDGKLLV